MSDAGVKPEPAEGNRARKPDAKPARPELEVVREPTGIDLPLVGHVGYRSLALYGGLALAGTVGVLEWPVAGALGVAYALAGRQG